MKKNDHHGRLNTAADVLQALLTNGKSDLSKHFQRWRLWHDWPAVVGPELSKYTYPVDYQKKALILWVDHPARIHDLHYIKDVLIEKVNTHLGKEWIRYIRFTTDRKAVPTLEQSDEDLRDYLSKQPPSGDGAPPRGQ